MIMKNWTDFCIISWTIFKPIRKLFVNIKTNLLFGFYQPRRNNMTEQNIFNKKLNDVFPTESEILQYSCLLQLVHQI